MDIHPDTMISETNSNRIATRITGGMQRYQVPPNGDDLTGSNETQAWLLVHVDRIRRWILPSSSRPIDTEEIHVIPQLQFQLNFRIMCSNIKGYLDQELQSLLLQDIIHQEFWNEFIDTLTSVYKKILSDYSVATRRTSCELEILSLDLEVVNEERYDHQRYLEHVSLLDTIQLEAATDDDDDDDDRTFRETPASQDSIDALKTMTYEESRYVTSSGYCDGDHVNHGCSICLNEYLNVSMIKWMPCSHLFHSECIEGWLKKKNTCPLCRFEMPTSKP